METEILHARTPAVPSPRGLRSLAALALALPALLLAGCGSGGSGGGTQGSSGELGENPDGGFFLTDPHQGGNASRVKIVDLAWGRLVDVHDVDPVTGEPNPAPIFRDFVINENVQSDGVDFLLETNPITQKTRLVVLTPLDPNGPPLEDGDADAFVAKVKAAAEGLSPIIPKSDAPGTPKPFSLIARNSALVIRTDDLLDDSTTAQLSLPQDVRVLTGNPPATPFENKRILFDRNRGGIADGKFHSTRVIVDMTVSAAEAASMEVPVGLNALGLPPSLVTTGDANVSVRIPSKTSAAAGQFSRLRNLSGKGLATENNGPVDLSSLTQDVVRAMRSGNAEDDNNGFLLDLNPPELLGGWPVTVDTAVDDPSGEAGFDFLIDITFATTCQAQPLPGNVVQLSEAFLEVTEIAGSPAGGQVLSVSVRSLSEDPVSAGSLVGPGTFQRTFDGVHLAAPSEVGCWVTFTPPPGDPPASQVAPSSQILMRFSEPMDPQAISPFGSFLVSRVSEDPTPHDLVVGEMSSSGDVKDFTFTPVLPLAQDPADPQGKQYTILLDGSADGITDLAGNPPLAFPSSIQFRLDPAADPPDTGGVVLRFQDVDEIVHPAQADGAFDLRGQLLFDLVKGVIKPRPVVRSVAIADRNHPVPALMTPFASGVQTPLSPLGSKLMHVWRYTDVGWSVTEEDNFNMDVEHLSWSPIGGQVVADVFPQYEMRLSHSSRLPDEFINTTTLLPTKPQSGLRPQTFKANVLEDSLGDGPEPSGSPSGWSGAQRIVHPKPLGYVVNPLDKFLTSGGTSMMPFPLNRGSSNPNNFVYYTWRDTAILEKAAPDGNGIALEQEVTAGVVGSSGQIAVASVVPTIGLPLLMEHRCFPTSEGLGLNSFDISLAITTSRLPAFRVFSTGGIDTSGSQVSKNPDTQDVPTGGFNPSSSPPGLPTPPDDPSWYVGQMDLISRVSRVHTIFIQPDSDNPPASAASVDFEEPVLEPKPSDLPSGTQVVLAFRGTTTAGTGQRSFDADNIDPYGDVRDAGAFIGMNTGVQFWPTLGNKTWTSDINAIDGAKFFQIRITFIGNTATLVAAELSGIGVAFTKQ